MVCYCTTTVCTPLLSYTHTEFAPKVGPVYYRRLYIANTYNHLHEMNVMHLQDPDKLIRVVQDSTKNLLHSFRDKANILRDCSEDIRLLIREGYNKEIAHKTALNLFGRDTTSFLAIDGTESQDQQLDMMIFYAGAFGYVGRLHFSDSKRGCIFDEPLPIEGSLGLSTAVSIREEDSASVAGRLMEGGLEVESERLPSALMQLSEYYIAVKTIHENPDIQIVILDRTLAGDLAHLIWSVAKTMEEDGSYILQGKNTKYGKVTGLDLELTRMLHANEELGTPTSRSHLIKYAAINKLLQNQKQVLRDNGMRVSTPQSITDEKISYKDLLTEIGADRNRLGKLQKDLSKLNKRYSFFHDDQTCILKPNLSGYWERVLSAAMEVCDHIFNSPANEHPLILSDPENVGKARWITVYDIDYLILVMIYALLDAAWERNILVIGIIKDISSAEMMKTVVPILQSTGMADLKSKFPSLNSDKAFLQTASIVNAKNMAAPWRTFEFDACFRTVVPPHVNTLDGTYQTRGTNEVSVTGAFKNLISEERMFVKSYIQLWSSKNDSSVRSHVFSYDRPCYPKFDLKKELTMIHRDGKVLERIEPILHFKQDSDLSHLVIDILCSMSLEVIPECLGHNYPLFLADKKAKSILEETRRAYLAAVSFEMANSEFNQQILYDTKFREYRSRMESMRRNKNI